MEDTLRVWGFSAVYYARRRVLILVLIEDTLRDIPILGLRKRMQS